MDARGGIVIYIASHSSSIGGRHVTHLAPLAELTDRIDKLSLLSGMVAVTSVEGDHPVMAQSISTNGVSRVSHLTLIWCPKEDSLELRKGKGGEIQMRLNLESWASPCRRGLFGAV